MTRSAALAAVVLAGLLTASPSEAWFEQRLAGSRAFSMGSAIVAEVRDVSALYWNPAGLAWIEHSQLILDFAQPYLSNDLSENAAAFATRWHGTGIAAGWHWVGIPGTYGELAASLSVGRVISRPGDGHVVAGGATLQYLRAGFDEFTVTGATETVDYGAQSAVSADLGVTWSTPWKLDFAWVGRDVVSPTITFIDGAPGGRIEAQHKLGAAFRWNPESTVTAGLTFDQGGATSLVLGGEIWFYDVFAIRSGFTELSKVLSAEEAPTEFQYTGGFGVKHKGWEVDASAFTNHELGVSYRASLLKTFGTGGGR